MEFDNHVLITLTGAVGVIECAVINQEESSGNFRSEDSEIADSKIECKLWSLITPKHLAKYFELSRNLKYMNKLSCMIRHLSHK